MVTTAEGELTLRYLFSGPVFLLSHRPALRSVVVFVFGDERTSQLLVPIFTIDDTSFIVKMGGAAYVTLLEVVASVHDESRFQAICRVTTV